MHLTDTDLYRNVLSHVRRSATFTLNSPKIGEEGLVWYDVLWRYLLSVAYVLIALLFKRQNVFVLLLLSLLSVLLNKLFGVS